MASQFEGWGRNLYLKTWDQWCEWGGDDGAAIFAYLVEVSETEGAVPRRIWIGHFDGRREV